MRNILLVVSAMLMLTTSGFATAGACESLSGWIDSSVACSEVSWNDGEPVAPAIPAAILHELMSDPEVWRSPAWMEARVGKNGETRCFLLAAQAGSPLWRRWDAVWGSETGMLLAMAHELGHCEQVRRGMRRSDVRSNEIFADVFAVGVLASTGSDAKTMAVKLREYRGGRAGKDSNHDTSCGLAAIEAAGVLPRDAAGLSAFAYAASGCAVGS